MILIISAFILVAPMFMAIVMSFMANKDIITGSISSTRHFR